MGKIVDIKSHEINYKFVTMPTYHEEFVYGQKEPETTQLCLIGIKDSITGREVAHPFSEFVLQKKRLSYNTMKNTAETIVRFMNFVIRNNDKYKLVSFSDIDRTHGINYINFLTYYKKSLKYINSEENNLNSFYLFLSKKNLLNRITINDFKKIKRGKKECYESLFKEARKPSSKVTRTPLHNIDEELIPLLLETAKKEAPRIALGVYMKMFGGIRGSEVCNIKTTQISAAGPYGEFGMSVGLETSILRKDIKNRNATMDKKNRIQEIELFADYLPNLYQIHLNNYVSTDRTNALFSNKNGKAITSSMYRYYFLKVKRAFIDILKKSGSTILESYALSLQTIKWNTHIGRGIYSNVMAEVTQNALLLQLARGDSSPESSIVYYESSRSRKEQRKEELDKMLTKKTN